MISNGSRQSSNANTTEVQTADNRANVPVTQQPSLFDYLALLPALITALTPLILGLRKNLADKDKDESDDE